MEQGLPATRTTSVGRRMKPWSPAFAAVVFLVCIFEYASPCSAEVELSISAVSGLTWREQIDGAGDAMAALSATQELSLWFEESDPEAVAIGGNVDIGFSKDVFSDEGSVLTGDYELHVAGGRWGLMWSNALSPLDPGLAQVLSVEGFSGFLRLPGYVVRALSGCEQIRESEDEEALEENQDGDGAADGLLTGPRRIDEAEILRLGGTFSGSLLAYRRETSGGQLARDDEGPDGDIRDEMWRLLVRARPLESVNLDAQGILRLRADEAGLLRISSHRLSIGYKRDELTAVVSYSSASSMGEETARVVEGLEGGIDYRARSGARLRADYESYASTDGRDDSLAISSVYPLGAARFVADYRNRVRSKDAKLDVHTSLSGPLGVGANAEVRCSWWEHQISGAQSGGARVGASLSLRPTPDRLIVVSCDRTTTDPAGALSASSKPGIRALVRYETRYLALQLERRITQAGAEPAGTGDATVSYLNLSIKSGGLRFPLTLSARYRLEGEGVGTKGQLVSAEVRWDPTQRFGLSATYQEVDPHAETDDSKRKTNGFGLRLTYHIGGKYDAVLGVSYQRLFGLKEEITAQRLATVSLSWGIW